MKQNTYKILLNHKIKHYPKKNSDKMKTRGKTSKAKYNKLYLPVVTLLASVFVLFDSAPVFALSGSATSTVTVSDATPSVGEQIVVNINIDVSGVNSPDNLLGSYTGTLNWNPAVLSYQSYSGAPPAGFTGLVTNGSGLLTFNGANASGSAGNIPVLSITFNVVGTGISALDLGYSAMGAATTFNDLRPILTVNDGSLVATAPSISYIGDIGSGTQSVAATLTTTIALSNTTSITAGDDIIIAYTTDAAPDIPLAITNSWGAADKYQQAAMGFMSAQIRTYIFVAYNVSGLTAGSGNTITITETLPTSGTQPQNRAAVASVFRGLAPVGALEQSSNGPANTTATTGTNPSSGAILTVQPVQLLIGAVGIKGADVASPGTWASGWINGPIGGATGLNQTISMAYQIVSSAGSYTASKTIPTARYWAATIASFKTSATGISYIGDIGSNQSKTAGTSLDITTNAAVAAGDDILIAFAADPSTNVATVTDNAGNTYNMTVDVTSTAKVRTTIFQAHVVTALPAGNPAITVHHDNITARSAVVSVFRGLASSTVLDKTMSAFSTSNGTSPSTGATGTTVLADELLVGAIGTEGGHYDAPGTWSNAFSQGPRLGTGVGTNSSTATDITTSLGWKIVSAVGAYTAQKQGTGSKPWAAGIATFKGGADIIPPTVIIDQASGQADPASTSPINFTVVFSEAVTDFATGDVTLNGTAGATTAIVTGSGVTYNVAVSGMTGSGTVIASINAGAAHDAASNSNVASTSTDNTVTFNFDNIAPAVTINQASGQADPASTSPINFTVVFSEVVTDFATGDVTLNGTAGATTAIVTGSGATYNVAVSGMTGSGTVIASINAGAAHDAASNSNVASTSADNTVTYEYTAPTVSYLGEIGSVTENAAGTSLLIPVGPAGVSAGNTIIVGFASRGASTYNEPVVTDNAGNTYSLDTFAVTYQHGRSYIFHAYVNHALTGGQNITITTTSVASRVAVAGVFSGLAEINALDQALGNPTGTSTTAQGNIR
jgi:hypothetical protein